MLEFKEKADHTEVFLYGAVGYDWDGFTDQDVVKVLNASNPEKPLHARINSEGGSVFDGFAIYNLLRQDPRDVTVTIDGVALSAASVIALAGDTVRAASASLFMIHNPWGVVMGDHAEMRKMAAVLETIRGQIAGVYARHGEGTADDYLEAMEAETWWTAEQAAEQGFVDEIIDAEAELRNYVLTGFKNTPARIKAHWAPPPAKLERAVSLRLRILEMDDLLTARQ